MDIEKARALAIHEMTRWGLIDRGWTLMFEASKKRLGVCVYKTRRIGLSTYFLNLVSEVEVLDTVRHEIAHALEFIRHGTTGHGKTWKAICIEVGAKPVARYNGPKLHHRYPYVLKYGDEIVFGYWKLPKDILTRLPTMAMKKRPNTKGQLKLFKVTYE